MLLDTTHSDNNSRNMFQRNSNISVGQVSQRSSASEQINDADFHSAASSPSNFSQPSTTTSNSIAKIIDIQKTRYCKQNDHHQTTAGEEESRHNRNSATTTGTVSGATSYAIVAPTSSSNQAQLEIAPASYSGGNNSSSNNNLRWSPNVTPRAASNQKQPSGETLSSFESDYDLLVYLGETETEDLVDTERSLDYQDQTWRQSICGASLAPTIDESLSELIGGPYNSGGQTEFDLLNTPTPLGINSPFTSPLPSRSLSSHQLDNVPLVVGTANQQQVRQAASNNRVAAASRQQPQQQRPQLWPPASAGNRRQQVSTKNNNNDDECDSEVLSVFSSNKLLSADLNNPQTTSGGNQARRYNDSDHANWKALDDDKSLVDSRPPQNQSLPSAGSGLRSGGHPETFYNKTPPAIERNHYSAQVNRQKSSTLASGSLSQAKQFEPNYPTKTCSGNSPYKTSEHNRSWREGDHSGSSSRLPRHIKANTMGRNQEQPVACGDELDMLLAEMSQSLDLDALARYDTQPFFAAPTRPSQPNGGRVVMPESRSQTLSRYERPPAEAISSPTTIEGRHHLEAIPRSWSSTGQKAKIPVERAQRLDGKQQQQQHHQQAASSESILDEYDGASRMLEQMITDQLEESAIARKRADQPRELKRNQRAQNQRADSLSQSIHSAGSRDSPKSVIANCNYSPASRSLVPAPLQRPTMDSSRGSRSSVAQRGEGGSAKGPSRTGSVVQVCSRKVSTCSSSACTTDISVVQSSRLASSKQYSGSQETGGREPLEKRSIWRPAGRIVNRGTSESSDNRKSIESAGQLVVRQLAADKQRPPTPPKVDYDACDPRANPEVIRLEAAEIPAASSGDEGAQKIQESQINRMKRRTMSSYRSMRNKISDLMAGDRAEASKKHRQVEERSQATPPQPPKRSSSIGSRSELPGYAMASSRLVVDAPPAERPSRPLKRRGQGTGDGLAASKAPSFGQQLRERLSRSKSRLSKLLRPDKARRAQSQPGGEPRTAGASDNKKATTNDNELLFQPGDLARYWTSGEPRTLPERSASSEQLDARTAPGDDDATPRADRILSPIPMRDSSNNSSLSGLDITSSAARSGRSARRKQRPPTKGASASSRPTSLISLKRLSASLRPTKEFSSVHKDEELDIHQGSLNGCGGGSEKLSKRARKRRRRAAAALTGAKQSAGCGGSSGPDSSSAGSTPKVLAAKVATTNDYFGQAAPPRVDSPDNHAAVAPSGGRQVGAEQRPRAAGSPGPEPQRPNRSQSLRSVRLMVPNKPEGAEAGPEGTHEALASGKAAASKRTVSFSNLNRRLLPSTTNTFRPASACAKLDVATENGAPPGQNAARRDMSLLVTPVGPSNAHVGPLVPNVDGPADAKFKPIPPLFGQHLLHPADQPPAARSKSAAMLDGIRHKCSSLFGSPAVRRRHTGAPSAPVPARPPRNRVRSKSAMASEDHDDADQVIEVRAATPDATLERSRFGSELPPAKSKLTTFAQHLKHSATDFFQGTDKRELQPQPPVRAQVRKTTTEDRSTFSHEWKPIIAVRDAKLANRSAGRSIVAGVLKAGKDGGAADDDDSSNEEDKEEEEARPALDNRTGSSRIAQFKSLQQRLKRGQQQQQQQQSLDTDSTWESSDDDDDGSKRDDTIECTTNDKSGVVPVRSTCTHEDDSSAASALGAGQAARADYELADDEPPTAGKADPTSGTANGKGCAIGDNSSSGSNAGEAAPIDDKAIQGRRAASGSTSGSKASEGFTCSEELNNNNISNNFGTARQNNNNEQQVKQAKREFEGGEEQLLQREQQQVALHFDGNSLNICKKATTASEQDGDDEKRNGVQQIGVGSQIRSTSSNKDRHFDDHQYLTSEQNICKTPFKFNADLPRPSQVFNDTGAVAGENLAGARRASDNHELEEAKLSDIPAPTSRQHRQNINIISSSSSRVPKDDLMAATLARQAPNNAATTRAMDETGARPHEALGRKRAPGPASARLLAEETEPAGAEEHKRLSVYENMPPKVEATGGSAEREKQKRGWRKPPWPPEKPARLRKVAAAADTTPPGSPSVWSVGGDDGDESIGLPKLPAEKLQQLNEALQEAREADSESRAAAPPAKPKRRLVTMTSIIQDPNDELMVAAQEPAAGGRQAGSFIRQDSALSIATNADNNNSDDSDSSFAAAAASRRRLVNRFENRPPMLAPRPKFPAFEDGKSALARQLAPTASSSGGAGQSLVRRLAKTFDQTAAAEQPARPGKPPVRGGAPFGGLGAARSSLELDEPRSEASSTWYDANSSEQLDEAEVAKFLAEFDAGSKGDEQSELTVSEEVSTGADPFVTVAESTLEEPRRGATGRDPATGEEPDEDDTLNDEVDDDDLNDDGEPFGDEALPPNGAGPSDDTGRAQQPLQGKDKTATSESEVISASSAKMSAASPGELFEGSRERPLAAGSGARGQMIAESSELDEGSRDVAEQPASEGGDNSETHHHHHQNNNNNDDSDNARCDSGSCDSSANTSTNIGDIGDHHAAALDAAIAVDDSAAAAAANTAACHATIPSESNTDAATAPGITTPNSPSADNTTTRDAPHVDIASVEIPSAANNPAAAAAAHETPPTTNTTCGAHIIDNTFKNSLNQIIARRSSQMGPLDETTDCQADATVVATTNSDQKHEKKNKTKKPKKAQEDGSISSKELKGLTRYYHALLGRRSRSKPPDAVPPVGLESQERAQASSSKPASAAAQIDDCIHSSSSSSSASSSTCPSASCSRSSSPISSRSPSPASSCASSAAQSDDDADAGRAQNLLRQMDDQKLMRDAKKCSRLYEELEKMLAHRMEQQHKLARSKPEVASSELPREVASASNQLDEDDFEDTFYSCSLASSEAAPDDQISLSSSSVSCESIPELKLRQNLQKLYHIVNEIHSSEAKFVDTLRLLNEDFRRHIQRASSAASSHAAANECVSSILKHLPQLQALNENLLGELKQARDQWPKTKKIAHVLVKIGPFLKHYSTYIREFDSLQQQFVDSMKKYPQFAERVREFEASERSQKLTVQHHLLRPIQRIPQYRLLLQQYLHHLKPDDVDYEDTVNALEVVSRVAEHANQSMNEGANFAKLLALQAKIVGKQRDIVQPGRLFVREGELLKVCRKQVQPRWFVLLNDALLYLTQIQSSDILYLNNELPLDDCHVSTPSESKQSHNLIGQQFETEFSVCTKTRSFALIAKSRQERDDWVSTFRKTIDEHLARRRSFCVRQLQQQQQPSPISATKGSEPRPDSYPAAAAGAEAVSQGRQQRGHLLGQKAPLWTPDSRVSMCQLCTSSFSALFRRHHCRCCGRVVCSACSSNKAPLVYLKCRSARVCDQCFERLRSNIHLYYLGGEKPASNEQELRRLDEHFRTLLKSQFVRHAGLKALGKGLRGSGESGRSLAAIRAAFVPNERLGANDSGSTISGYLHRRHPTKAKWKRQWFVIRDKVLYAYRAIDDVAAVSSTPLLGFTVEQPSKQVDGLEPKSLILLRHLSDYARCSTPSPPQLLTAAVLAPASQPARHENLKRRSSKGKADEQQPPPVIEHLFKAESVGAAERWLGAFRNSVILDDDQLYPHS